MTFHAGRDDPHPVETTVGTPQSPPTLSERLDRALDVHAALADLRVAGAESRVLRDRTTGWQRLRELIETARGELLIADPYFGQDEADWALVDGLPISVRVLTCKIAGEPAPVPEGVKARIRPKGTKVLHDRAYAWQEGGFMLGGSPSTIGGAPVAAHGAVPSRGAAARGDVPGALGFTAVQGASTAVADSTTRWRPKEGIARRAHVVFWRDRALGAGRRSSVGLRSEAVSQPRLSSPLARWTSPRD